MSSGGETGSTRRTASVSFDTAAAPPVLVASEVPPRLQAVRAKAVEAAIETASTRRTDGFLRVMRVIVVYFSLGELASIDNVVFLLVC
jgi:hypothetical protein